MILDQCLNQLHVNSLPLWQVPVLIPWQHNQHKPTSLRGDRLVVWYFMRSQPQRFCQSEKQITTAQVSLIHCHYVIEEDLVKWNWMNWSDRNYKSRISGSRYPSEWSWYIAHSLAGASCGLSVALRYDQKNKTNKQNKTKKQKTSGFHQQEAISLPKKKNNTKVLNPKAISSHVFNSFPRWHTQPSGEIKSVMRAALFSPSYL